ncbi:MAG: sugar ABC transporter ATP-binding protein [Alphaproteobacteria bacterium]|nr:sugar ABC transporter ATP-binding protein [Alphaproteobacteria bacterium]
MTANAQVLLEARGISKSFDGNTVLKDADLVVRAGEIHAVVGENGAGKSTLIKILAGVYQPNQGVLLVTGDERRLHSPRDALDCGIVVIHQEFSLSPHLSAEENICLGHFPVTAIGTVDRREMRRRTLRLLERLAVNVDPAQAVGDLSVAQQQMVEIAKALSFDARVLILDEPTAVLDHDRVRTLFGVLDRLRTQGLGIVYISHHLDEVFEIADRVTVLRDGERTGQAAVSEIDHDWIVNRMIGRAFPVHHKHVRSSGKIALRLDQFSQAGVFEDISLTVREGEIVGLAGLVGARRSEIAQAIIGLTRPTGGALQVFGERVTVTNPRAAAGLGIAYVTEDRKARGLFLNRPVSENLTMANLARFFRFPFLRRAAERRFVSDMIRALDVRLASVSAEMRTLSGGNQQKCLIGAALAVEPRILILDEPTRGVDIGAKQEIYRLVERLTSDGLAILLISSEMEEILRLSDRVVVLREGRVTATLGREEASEAKIMKAAAFARGNRAA